MAVLETPLIRGDYEVVKVWVTEPDPDDPEGPLVPRDISGDVFVFTAKLKIKDLEPIIQKVTGDGVNIVDGPAGYLEVELLPEDTASLLKETVLKCDIEGIADGVPPRPYTHLFDLKVLMDVGA